MAIAVEIVDYTVTSGHSVVGGELKVLRILTFVTIGEKGILRDNFVIFMPYG
tara:strand:- start:364 stop:519 length:156 start_codon:yes stop_codon:yes gene_type:complete